MIAPQVVSGLLQKVAMTSMPVTMAEQGMKYTDRYIGGLTPQQRKTMESNLDDLRKLQSSGSLTAAGSSSGASSGGIVSVHARAVVGQDKKSPAVSYYAAAVGVMFLLFTASGSAGALLDEAESGTLDRVLSSRVTMTSLLAGKLTYNTLLAFTQLTVMFVWASAVFHVDLVRPYPGLHRHGAQHRRRRGSLRHVAGQHVPHARAAGRNLYAAHSRHVVDRRQHVPALFDA